MEGITYSEQIGELIDNLTELRVDTPPDQYAVARELSIAITALEDAQMRVNRAGVLRKGKILEPAAEL